MVDQFDDVLVRFYGYPNNGRPLFPPFTPLYNKFVGRVLASGSAYFPPSFRFRNLRVGKPATVDKLHVVEVVRFRHSTFIHNLGGRKPDTWCSALHVKNGHHVGKNYYAPGCTYNPPLPQHCRSVCIDACKLRWRSVDSVAFHSFAWPRNVKEAKRIARTLYTNHCDWVDVLIVRGRCFCDHSACFRANRVLEHLLWKWSKMRRPYEVYREGAEEHVHSSPPLGADPVPGWLEHECVYNHFCKCNLVGPRHPDWHHLGALYSNVVSRRRQLFKNQCCCSQVLWPFLHDCNKTIKNMEVAIHLCRIVIHVLIDVLPSVPQRGEPLVSVLTSREFKPKWERLRLRKICWDVIRCCVLPNSELAGGGREDSYREISEEESVT